MCSLSVKEFKEDHLSSSGGRHRVNAVHGSRGVALGSDVIRWLGSRGDEVVQKGWKFQRDCH